MKCDKCGTTLVGSLTELFCPTCYPTTNLIMELVKRVEQDARHRALSEANHLLMKELTHGDNESRKTHAKNFADRILNLRDKKGVE